MGSGLLARAGWSGQIDSALSGRALSVRRAVPGDVSGLLALEGLFPSDRITRRSFRRLIGSPSAFVWVVPSQNQPKIHVEAALVLLVRRNTRVARIYSLAVAPSVRGHGLATALIETAHREAINGGKSAISLEVRCENAAAQALYYRLGYTLLRRLPAYYADGSDGLRLRKELHR